MKMPTTHKLITMLLLSSSLIACKKKTSSDPPLTINTTTTKQLFDDAFNSMIQTTTFDASNTNFTFTSARGAKVTINGTCLRKDGNPITGQVTLEFFEAYNRVDMATANKPTMGYISPGVYEMLETGGQFYINLKQGSNKLTTACAVQVSVPAAETGGIDMEMSAFRGTVNPEMGLSWRRDSTLNMKPNFNENWYDLQIPDLGWFNIDKYMNDPRPKTSVACNFPPELSGNPVVLLIDKAGTRGMSYVYGMMPVGMECYLIMVSAKDGKYQWIINTATLTASHTETFSIANARTGTQAEYRQAIQALP